jgi:transposase
MTPRLIGHCGQLSGSRAPLQEICLPPPFRFPFQEAGLIRSLSALADCPARDSSQSRRTWIEAGREAQQRRKGMTSEHLRGVEFVIGVDTHKSSYTAAVVSVAGAELERITVASDVFGHKKLLAFAKRVGDGRRLWAIEGSGSFGRGLTTYLLGQGEAVGEIDRPSRPSRRNGAKTDDLDAVRAAREAFARPHLAQPRRRGLREAMRVLVRTRTTAVRAKSVAICHLKALIVTAPGRLRDSLRNLNDVRLAPKCARLRTNPQQSAEHRATIAAIRATARRILWLEAEAEDHASDIELLVQEMAPHLLTEVGVGPLTAAELIIAWSHSGRVRSEAAFAQMAGVAPIPASSGKVTRHRLNRCGDRHLNCALHQIVLARLLHHDETRAYYARRTAEGRTPKEIKRCLKRFMARRVFRLLEARPLAY